MRKSESVMSYSDSYKLSYSDLFRVSIDPRVKPEGDRKESVPEGDERRKNVPEGDERRKNVPEGNGIINMYRDDNLYKVMPQFGANRQTIFELDEKLNNRKIPRIFCDAKNRDDFNLRMTVLKIGSSLDDCLRNRGMSVLMICILVSSTSMTGIVRAECTPTPDCASIGYTETSCDGKFVRCPFDTSKLFCVPCDSAYKYTCSGVGYASGSGTACNGKYVSCTCTSGYEWDNASGICKDICTDHRCSIGNILYSDMSCCKDKLDSKTAIGIVVKDNELVMSQMSSSVMIWGTRYLNISLTDYHFSSDAETDYKGRTNTATIIAEDSGVVAAKYCNDYITAGTNAGDWYLPSAGELHSYVHGNYSVINPTITTLGWSLTTFWSSTEELYTSAWVGCSALSLIGNVKNATHNTACFLPVRVTNGVAEPCSSEYKYRCDGENQLGTGDTCGGYYKKCECSSGYEWSESSCISSCSSSSSNYCWVHGTCHGDCCSNGTYESCDPICGGSGCSEPDCGCPASICSAVGGTYSGGCCSESCDSRRCDECACEAGGGILEDGFCTDGCGMCLDINIGGGGD